MKFSSFLIGGLLLSLAVLIASPVARVYFVSGLIRTGGFCISLTTPPIEGYSNEAQAFAFVLGLIPERQNRTAVNFRRKTDLLGYASVINPAVTVTTLQTQQSKVTVYVVTPNNVVTDKIILYCHGGYHVAGSWFSHGGFVSEVAAKFGGVIYFPEFKLAPEHPMPAATLDIVELYEELLEKYDSQKIFIAGDSAGGGEVALSMLKIRERGLSLPRGGWMISPHTDFTWSSPSVEANKPFDKLIKEDLIAPFAPQCLALGLPNNCDKTIDKSKFKDPRYSPLFADLRGLPPLYIQVSKHERLYDDARLFAEKAKSADVDVTFREYPYQQHVFQVFGTYIPEGRAAIEDAVQWLTLPK